MLYRRFGQTDMRVSEVSFGSWAIGGGSYGASSRKDALAALARAEELGCNFVDTAKVYGQSEDILGEFLRGRRERWLLASKYSGQQTGIEKTLEEQLRTLQTDVIDYYQLHWAPRAEDQHLYDTLARLKQAGKVRYVGVSLYNVNDIDHVINHAAIDGIQVCLSLLDPIPFTQRLESIAGSGLGVVIRSCLKEGFLTGKFGPDVSFLDPNDQRSRWSRTKIRRTLKQVESMRFLESPSRTLMQAACAYPLSFPQCSTLLLGTRNAAQADINFGTMSGLRLSADELAQIIKVQKQIGLYANFRGIRGILRKLKNLAIQ